jgi:hypothetical protein
MRDRWRWKDVVASRSIGNVSRAPAARHSRLVLLNWQLSFEARRSWWTVRGKR